ncbi:hypothetical protein GCM10009092_05430 [Bowmanella denitrificans]|uniref:Uncharacterized protein n=1 Tax=Bowmanella denitrificans TaxID=366582 RepID=A0ABN0WPX9_9ALTE|nr:hypothetical protein [Bowmanella denitrificans]
MTTQALIKDIESLSATLNEQQLSQFLDIMDAMAVLLAEAQSKAEAVPLKNQTVSRALDAVGVH